MFLAFIGFFNNPPAKNLLKKASYQKRGARPRAYMRARKKGIGLGVCEPPASRTDAPRRTAKKLSHVAHPTHVSGLVCKPDAAAMMHARKRAVFGRFGAI